MKKKVIILSTCMIFISLICSCVSAQKLNSGWNVVDAPKKKGKTPKGFSFVEGGAVITPEDYFQSLVFDSTQVGNFLLEKNKNSPDTIFNILNKFSVASFFLSKTEVTNKQYKEFIRWVIDSIGLTAMAQIDPSYYLDPVTKSLNWSRRKDVMKYFYSAGPFGDAFASALAVAPEEQAGPFKAGIDVTKLQYRFCSGTETVNAYPDTLVWLDNLPNYNNDPLEKYYFSHPLYNDYPVVGVSWHQANAYCDWLSRNSDYEFRLPLFAEYVSAYTDKRVNKSNYKNGSFFEYSEINFPWGHNGLVDKNGIHLANFGIVKDPYGFLYKSYYEDGSKKLKSNSSYFGYYTTKVASFPQTVYGLYDLAGNVAEWTGEGFSDIYVLNTKESPNAFTHDINPYLINGGYYLNINLKDSLLDIRDKIEFYFGTHDYGENFEYYTSRRYNSYGLVYHNFANKLISDLAYLSKLKMPKAVIGGSFIDSPQFLIKGVIKAYSAGDAHSFIGFRVAADVIWE